MANSAHSSHTIGRGTRIVGKVRGDGDLVVEGRLEGELTLDGHLHVGAAAEVIAPVDVVDLTVEGTVEGDVAARGAVVVRQGATLRGAIRASRVAIEEGTRFTGRVEMDVELPPELATGATARSDAARGRR